MPRPLTSKWLPSLVACSLAVIGFIAEAVSLPTPDISFYLYGTERILEGARLYRDIIEVNPPLIFWLNLSPVLIANALHLPDVLVYRLSVVALLLGTLALSQDSLKRITEDQKQPSRAWLNVLLVFDLFALPGEAFGEREHLMFALILPYLLAIGAQAGSLQPIRRAWLIGLLAGIGLSLKPYFLLLLVALEAWLWVRAPKTRRLRPEFLAAAVTIAAYGLLVYFLTPEYFEIVRPLGALYRRYLSMPILDTLIVGIGSGVPLIALLAYSALRQSGGKTAFSELLAVGATASLVVAIIQQKGWWYHFYPSDAISVVLLGVLLARASRVTTSLSRQVYALGAAGALIFVTLSALGRCLTVALHPMDQKFIRYPEFFQLQRLVRERAAGRTVMVWSFNNRSAFPLVPSAGAKWGSSFPHLWLVPASYWESMEKQGPIRFRPLAERTWAERFLDSVMVSDMQRRPPELLLILRPSQDTTAIAFRRLDFRAYFAEDPRIARMLNCYRYIDRIGVHDVYQRSTEPGCEGR